MASDGGTRDRKAYLEQQIERQKRGDPIDVEWVRGELERVRREQTERMSASQRNLRFLVIGSGGLLLVLWLGRAGLDPRATLLVAAVALIVGLAAWTLSRRRR
jgi:hypothetical protein